MKCILVFIHTLFRNMELQENQLLLYDSTKTGNDTVSAELYILDETLGKICLLAL